MTTSQDATSLSAAAGTADPLDALKRNGFAILEDVLPTELTADLAAVCDRVYQSLTRAPGIDPLHLVGCLDRDEKLIELIDAPRPLSVIRRALDDDVYVYWSHLDVHPPVPDPSVGALTLGWHQDFESITKAMPALNSPLSVKVGFYLSDVVEIEDGPMYVLPGTHAMSLRPADVDPHADGVPVLMRAGSAVVFDHRLWHGRGRNHAQRARKAVFLAYAFRWIRPRHHLRFDEAFIRQLSPTRRQLLDVLLPGEPLDPRQMSDGHKDVGRGDGERYHDPKPVDIPLRDVPLAS